MLLCCLYLLWIILNGRITGEILIIGIPVSLLVWFFALMVPGFSAGKDFKFLAASPRILSYFLFLWKEIVLSALRVMRRIWTPGQPVSAVVEYNPGIGTLPGRVLLADSITLTPGTITLEAEDGSFQVHCLEEGSAEDLKSGIMLQKVRRLEENCS